MKVMDSPMRDLRIVSRRLAAPRNDESKIQIRSSKSKIVIARSEADEAIQTLSEARVWIASLRSQSSRIVIRGFAGVSTRIGGAVCNLIVKQPGPSSFRGAAERRA